MQSIQEKILLYFELPLDEQADLDRQIQGNPALESLFAESQALHFLLKSVGESAGPDGSALVDFVLFGDDELGNASNEVVSRRAQTESAIREHPELQAKIEAIKDAIVRLTETAEDPVVRFERLVRRSPNSAASSAADREKIAGRQGMKFVRPIRLALAACVGLVAVYGVLFFVSSQSQSQQTKLAGLNNATEAFEELAFRGSSEESPPSDLTESLILVREARSTTLGLFPSFDDERLEAAAVLAERAAARGDQNSIEAARALYILGKIRLHQGRNEDAAEALQVVVDRRAEGAEDARRMLDYIRTQ